MIDNQFVWLVEYVGAVPCPVYAAANYVETRGNHTLDALAARAFETKAEAEAWMLDPQACSKEYPEAYPTQRTCLPFGAPWQAIEHGFFGRRDR